MREQVLQYIRECKLLKAGDRVAVAVSAGADSVALLRVLLGMREELGIVLHVAHFNHQLRGDESDADERFVAELAHQYGLPFFSGRGEVRQHAQARKQSLEHAARELRYVWLTELACSESLDVLATAHNADDQAETVLMKFLRGAGTRGLAGIYPLVEVGELPVIRPLLQTPRLVIERYLRELKQPWREDHTNLDTQHTRNRIRHELLPLLERNYNPNLRNVLMEMAEIARAEEDFWNQTIRDTGDESDGSRREIELFLFEQLHVAPQRRALKKFLEWNGLATDFHLIESLRICALGELPRVDLNGGWRATRSDDRLKLQPPGEPAALLGYQYTLAVPGEVRIPEIKATISAKQIEAASAAQASPGTLLRLDRVGHLTFRNWRPGDRFRPAHSSSEEKLKRLFAEKHIPAELRVLWPVALSKDDHIVWVRGFLVAHDFVWTPGSGDALRIEALPSEPPQDTSSPPATSK